MRKVFGLLLCLVVVPMLFAEADLSDFNNQGLQTMNPAPTQRVLHGENRVWDSRLVLWSQIPDTVGASNMACQRDTVLIFYPDVADDIDVTGSWDVDTVISWWWNWNGFTSWSLVPNIHFMVYDNNGGQPADNPAQLLVIEQADYAAFEYVAGQRYRLELYPATLTISTGGINFIEIQPTNVFSANGQTGIIGEPGIGNGNQAWFRSAYFGYPNWVTAQTVFGTPNEAGFVLLGTSGGGPTHDVGCTGISAPPTMVMPGTSHDPVATYRNFGSGSETFDVYFDIDSAGTNVYTQTDNITLASGTDTTITWATWTAGPTDGLTYTCYGYTVLSGDENPANDTSTRTVVTNSTYWEILDPPAAPTPSSGHSCAAVAYDDDVYYVMNLHPTGSYIPQCDRYNISTNTWDAAFTTNPYGAGSYGTASPVNGKIYCIGGCTTWPNGLNRVHIYDPASDTWAQGANAPTGLLDHAAGVYADRYIITFGNGNWGMTPTNEVYVYDTENDSWATGTSFPGEARGAGAFGVVDTYAVGACGYTASGGYADDYIVGMIDPTDPANITWGAWSAIGMPGRYRVPSAQDEWNKCVWVINGQNGPFSDTWSYDPYTDTWTDWQQPKPMPVGNVTPMAVTMTAAGDIGVFVPSGYAGSYVPDHEVFHTGAIPGVSEIPGEVAVATIGFAPTMNPVKDFVSISYAIDTPANVTLKVYDHSGRLVRILVDNRAEAEGTRTVHWNGKDDNGRHVANGVYFFTLEAAGQTATHKVTLVK